MTVIVVDASVLVPVLIDEGELGLRMRGRLVGEVLAAPELIDLEVVSVLRRLTMRGTCPLDVAATAVTELADLPVRREPHRPLVTRCWELRHSLTAYDASYVALAESLGAALVTADGSLSRAPGPRCPVELLR